jgi:hypothetical protein
LIEAPGTVLRISRFFNADDSHENSQNEQQKPHARFPNLCHDFLLREQAMLLTRAESWIALPQNSHHTFLSTMQLCIASEARRIAANIAKLSGLLRTP